MPLNDRILQYDLSRGRIPRAETILAHADLLRPFGLTGVMLYIECVVENSVFPACGCGATPVTAAWLAAVREGLKRRGLDLYPCIEVLGHQENLLALPAFAVHGETGSGACNFRIDAPETRDAVKRWLGELLAHFETPLVHAACDEAFKLGLGRSAPFIRERGFEAALADYLNDLAAFLRARGRTMMVTADPLIHYPALRGLLAPDVVVCNWGYGTWTEVYERENHNFARHAFVTAGRRNWAWGNCMAEYILTPFDRLEANTGIWLGLCAQSGAEGFIIGDWGSYSNVNPFAATVIGALYVLRRLADPAYTREAWLDDVSRLVLGRRDDGFREALRLMTSVQNNARYFGNRLADWSPVLPALFLGDPDSRPVVRLSALFERGGIDAFIADARLAVARLDAVRAGDAPQPALLDALRHLARRMLLTALRTRICHDHAWATGAIWLAKEDFDEPLRRRDEYRALAAADLGYTMAEWDRDCLESERERCRRALSDACDSAAAAVRITDNSLYRFPPRPV